MIDKLFAEDALDDKTSSEPPVVRRGGPVRAIAEKKMVHLTHIYEILEPKTSFCAFQKEATHGPGGVTIRP